jgi:excisionase family DNA binding protein
MSRSRRVTLQHNSVAEQQPTNGATEAALVELGPEGPRPRRPWLAPLLLNIADAALLLGLSARSLKRMASAGELPREAIVRLGRRRLFSRPALERWVNDACPRPRACGRR